MTHRGRIATLALSVLIAAAGIAAGPGPNHGRADCRCIECVPVTSKSKATRYEYQSKVVGKCFVPARLNLLGRLHHREPAPERPVAIQRRVLMKRAIVDEKPTTAYEARDVGPK